LNTDVGSPPVAAESSAPEPPAWLLPAITRFPRLGSEGAQRSTTETFDAHVATWGALSAWATPQSPESVTELVAEIAAAELTGRGGGHFPAARKWLAVLAAGPGGVVVANGAEGEPLSAKDAALLQTRPHLVLDGLQLAALATGAENAYIWLHAGRHAIVERRAAGLPGPSIELRTGPEHYLSGESSAVMQALSGGPALPAFRRVPGTVSGVQGRPTLLHNVETLARIAVIARGFGASCTQPRGGIPSSLVTVITGEGRTVTEVRPAASLSEVVTTHVPGVRNQAVLLGGYGGSWVPWATIASIAANEQSARAVGLSIGAGILAPLSDTSCGVSETARIVDYLADSSARQCGPCLFGLRYVADLINSLAAGNLSRSDRRNLTRYLSEISGRGGCHHPDGAIRLVNSMLTTFDDDVDSHLRKGRCRHGSPRPSIPVPGS
jgi:NADH:ubiquinone oxidoreductase subunit F (NADH-binding)